MGFTPSAGKELQSEYFVPRPHAVKAILAVERLLYGNMIIGPADETTWLRVVKRSDPGGTELYTAYSSNDGEHWTHGGTWQHNLGSGAQIGLSAENAAGFS